jgi:hypothetical protein
LKQLPSAETYGGRLWNTARIGKDRYKVVVEPENVRSLAAEHVLVVQSGFAFAAGDVIEVFVIEVDIFKVEHLLKQEFGRFNWKLWISGDHVPELRDRLTFRVEGRSANSGPDLR